MLAQKKTAVNAKYFMSRKFFLLEIQKISGISISLFQMSFKCFPRNCFKSFDKLAGFPSRARSIRLNFRKIFRQIMNERWVLNFDEWDILDWQENLQNGWKLNISKVHLHYRTENLICSRFSNETACSSGSASRSISLIVIKISRKGPGQRW